MGIFNVLGGVGISSAPLINFDTIIDEDLSLVSYILAEIKNYDIFDFERLKDIDSIQLTAELYHRKYNNPLYYIMKPDESKIDFIDQCYKEFMEDMSFLSKYSIATDVYKMVSNFISAPEIRTTIIYKNNYEKDIIENDSVLSKAYKVNIDEFNIDRYTQIYLNKIEDAERYIDKSIRMTYYFSTRGTNLNEDNTELIHNDIISNIASTNNISVFDMYKDSVIGRSFF